MTLTIATYAVLSYIEHLPSVVDFPNPNIPLLNILQLKLLIKQLHTPKTFSEIFPEAFEPP
jgi:hypothetical protein